MTRGPMTTSPGAAHLAYVDRVNRAIDFIVANLAAPMQLEDVARVAHFSPFHFHRVFKAVVGETLNGFIKRVRLQRALYLLAHRDAPPLTAVALACGFSSSSSFSRSFKQHYGVPPREFDLGAFRRERRAELDACLPAAGIAVPCELQRETLQRQPAGANPDGFEVRLVDHPERHVAYIRVLRPFESDAVSRAAERLVAWAAARNLAGGQWLGYMWEDPEIVPLAECRYDVGVVVPDPVRPDGEVGCQTFAPMRVAEVPIRGGIELEQRAIDWLFGTWLPQSGLAPDHQPAFEAWDGLPFAHGDAHFELRCELPVVDAAQPV